MTQTTEDYASRLTKILGNVESAKNDAEAEASVIKAHELTVRHVIDEALEERSVEIGSVEIEFSGIFALVNVEILRSIVNASGCEMVKRVRRYGKPKSYAIEVIGETNDVERVKALNAAVQIYATRSVKQWRSDRGTEYDELTPWRKFRDRREFRRQFARRLATNLEKARRIAEYEVAMRTIESTRGSVNDALEVINDASRRRVEAVAARLDEKYGRRRTRRASRTS